MDAEHEQAKDAAERTFAILTATYHHLPERDGLIAELSRDQALQVIGLMSALLGGTFIFAEMVGRDAPGSALVSTIERLRAESPWLDWLD